MKNIKKYKEFISENKVGDYMIPDYTVKDYTKRPEVTIKNPTLKERLISHFQEQESDFDPEETVNVLEILTGYDDDLNGLSNIDKTLILRMVNDSSLYEEVDSIVK